MLLPIIILPILFGWIRIAGERYGVYDPRIRSWKADGVRKWVM